MDSRRNRNLRNSFDRNIVDKQVDKTDILGAVYDYLHEITRRNDDHFTWGDGDSLDRERVRDILVIRYGYDKTFYGGSVLWEDFANEN